jgi:hypothetical protein
MRQDEVKGTSYQLVVRANSPIRFILPNGGAYADGYEATMLSDMCAVIIEAEQKGFLGKRGKLLAERAALSTRAGQGCTG